MRTETIHARMYLLSLSLSLYSLLRSSLMCDSVRGTGPFSYTLCHLQVSVEYRKLQGISQAQAVLAFMALIQQQPRYGIHYFNVKVCPHSAHTANKDAPTLHAGVARFP